MAKRIWSKAMALAFVLMLAPLLAACGSETSIDIADDGDPAGAEVPVMGPQQRVLAFGDSLFAGYGVGLENSYPAKLQNALRARGTNAVIVNAGVSGDTSAAGLQRLKFTLDAQDSKPDLFILELGGNDLLRGLSPDQTRDNLAAMLEELKSRDIPVLVMGMRAPPNYGTEYQQAFDAIYPDLARKYDAELVPFFLEAIYTDPKLFQRDRIHPTVEGIEIVVGNTVDEVADALD